MLLLCLRTELEVKDRSLKFVTAPFIFWGALPEFSTLQIWWLVLELIALEKNCLNSKVMTDLSWGTGITYMDYSEGWHSPITPFQNAAQLFRRFKLISQTRGNKAQQVTLEYRMSAVKINALEKLWLWSKLGWSPGNVIWALGGRLKLKYLHETSPCL